MEWHQLSPAVADALRASDKRIVITGAGGWIGMATLDLLAAALGDQFDDRVVAFGSSARPIKLVGGQVVEQRPLIDIDRLAPSPTLVLHLAFLTKDRAEAMDEVAYRTANATIDSIVLSALDRMGATGVFVASSGAAGFADDPEASAAMRLYGSLKVDQERAFSTWADDSRQRLVIGRLFNLSGPYINKRSSYALASFLLDSQAGKPIQIAAPHAVVRGYVAIREMMSLVFAALLDETGDTLRFATGGRPVEIGDLAALVAAKGTGAAIERAAAMDGRKDIYVGDDASYRDLLATYGIEPMDLARQIEETADFLRFSSIEEAREKLDIGRSAW